MSVCLFSIASNFWDVEIHLERFLGRGYGGFNMPLDWMFIHWNVSKATTTWWQTGRRQN